MEIAEIINDIKNEIDAIEFNVANIDMTENLKRTKNSHLFFLKEVVSRLESLAQPTGVEVWVCMNKLSKRGHESMVATKDKPNVTKNAGYEVWYDMNGVMYEILNRVIFEGLNISPGQCKKFIITECVE